MKLAQTLALVGALYVVSPAVFPAPTADIAGREKKPHNDTVLLLSHPLSKAAQQELLDKMHSIRDRVLATPALRSLRGHDWTTFDSLKNDHRDAFPVVGRVSYIAFPYFEHKGKVESSAEGAPFTIHINDPDIVLGQNGYNLEKDAGFTLAPKVIGDLHGYPVYQEQFVVLTKDRRPLFVPVSTEQYLQVKIANARKELAEMHKRNATMREDPKANQREIDGRLQAIRNARAENEQRWAQMQPRWPDRVTAERARFDEKEKKLLAEVQELKTTTPRQRFLKPFEARLAGMEAEMAALSAAERAAPAYLANGKSTRASGLSDTGPTDLPVSKLNPAVFDPTKPKHSIQLITLGTTRYMPAVYGEVQKQLDFGALVALLE